VSTLVELPSDMTVNDVVRLWPATVAVFNSYGIDACCGGAVPVPQAAARDGADPAALMHALLDAIRGDRP
jgi:regulator of cell morphogenesis and NO signaling